jgi:nitroimidazol reductase NimA-like FMN-containing flavoprotein (pyridoxamine 5'-phosphate oxidase superfamily)
MPGYGLPRGAKGLLPWAWADTRLTRSHNYWIITTRSSGAPHAMVVWGVWIDGRFYFSTGRESRKARNLAANASCVICTEKAAEAVILEGTATEITDPAAIARVAPAYGKKYKPWKLDPEMGGIYEVQPRVIFGMWEKKFNAATRWIVTR